MGNMALGNGQWKKPQQSRTEREPLIQTTTKATTNKEISFIA